jgi:hypothetical protein
VFLIPAVAFFFTPSFILLSFGAIDVWLWFVSIRAVHLFLIRSEYEFFAGSGEIRWGWSHDPAGQTRIRTDDLRAIEYSPMVAGADSSTLEFVLADGTYLRLNRALSDRNEYAEEILTYLLAEHPTLLVRGFTR